MNDAKGGSNQFVAVKMTLKTTHLNLPFSLLFMKSYNKDKHEVLVLAHDLNICRNLPRKK